MLFAFIIGLLKRGWPWFIAVVAIGLLLELYRVNANRDWWAQIGREPYDARQFLIAATLIVIFDAAAYALGYGVRHLFDRTRKAS
ncbi:hypothetical protein [Shinella zoogloeoides]|uniref:hypothetical protein n=1 Tax=Shinella zoogloeoides TaxID=352475 RepID=UPI0028A6B4DE|nr:hypothetical protein [Shinella zoogloeoides]